MSMVYLNGEYLAASEAKISPMDRGFLFGDGIYEVIPSYNGLYLGFSMHIERLFNGLAALRITLNKSPVELKQICDHLLAEHQGDNVGVYIQVSRGVSPVRQHGFSNDMDATVFVYTFDIPAPPDINNPGQGYKVLTQSDKRWLNRHVKSTALLGNVLHYQDAKEQGFDETLLFNGQDQLTEAAACNVFIVKDGVIATPPLDNEKLPGITRAMLIAIVKEHSDIPLQERVITRDEVLNADEIWITSSSKQLAWVSKVDEVTLPTVTTDSVWYQVQGLFSKHQFDFD